MLAVLLLCLYLPPLLLFKWDLPRDLLLLFGFFLDLSWRLCLAHSFCFVSFCLFAFDFRQFFLKQDGLSKQDSTEENLSWNSKIFISRRRKWWCIQSSLKEIVNFVFNKSTQETRRTLLSKLILHKKTPRKRTHPKKDFDIKYQRMVFHHLQKLNWQ